ncbi:MAG: hypothetical protein AAF928_19545, partial [Myxococcota bacterium]
PSAAPSAPATTPPSPAAAPSAAPSAPRPDDAAGAQFSATVMPSTPTVDTWAPPPVDPMLPTGVTMASVGGVGALAGVIMLARSGGQGVETCGLSGCFVVVDQGYRASGIAMLTSGLVLGTVGAGVALGGATGPPRRRHSDPMVVAGSTLTGLGLASAAAGGAAWLSWSQTHRPSGGSRHVGDDSDVFPWAVTLLGVGGASLAAGIPLWVAGAADWEPPRELPPGYEVRDRNPRMAKAGMVMTAVGGATLLLPPAVMATGDGPGPGAALLISAVSGLGGLSLLIGIPLWVSGGKDVVVRRKAARREVAARPDVELGLGHVRMTWTY